MESNKLFQKKHELWLKILYGSLIVKDGVGSSMLNSMANNEFRHLKWLGIEIVEGIANYDYDDLENTKDIPKMFNFDREELNLKAQDAVDIYKDILATLEEIHPLYSGSSSALVDRMRGDEEFFAFRIKKMIQGDTAKDIYNSFDGDLSVIESKLSISEEDTKNLIRELRKLHDKEYKTVISFMFVIIHTAQSEISEILYDLMLESLSHQKHYAKMMSALGFLEAPSIIEPREYQVGDIKKFMQDSIIEEQEEQIELLEISKTIPYDDFQKLVEYVGNQEKHHIELLRKIVTLI